MTTTQDEDQSGTELSHDSDKDESGADREPRDGESRDGAGHVRPVPPHVPPTPEVEDVE